MEIKSMNKLTSNEKASIEQLISICGIFDKTRNTLFLSNEFNVYADMNCFFLYYHKEKLSGILSIYADTKSIAEISAYVLPSKRQMGIFTTLYKESLKELKKYNYGLVHFKTEKSFLHRIEIAHKLHATLVDTEYLMEYDKFNNVSSHKNINNLITRKALKEDLPALSYLQVKSFEEPYELCNTYVKQSFDSMETYLYTAVFNDEIVGTCSVDISGPNNLIFGLCVMPNFQGKGIGSTMIKSIVLDIMQANDKPITICVESDNKIALKLYTSSGFNIISHYEYYESKI